MKAIQKFTEAVNAIAQLKNTTATVATIDQNHFKPTTLKGLKSYFKFTAHKLQNIIYGWSNSTSLQHFKVWRPSEKFEMTDIVIN